MIKRSFLFVSVIMVLSITGCIKETYNMNMLSKKAHLSPTLAISAVKGDIAFSDMVKPNDTVVFDQNKLVTLVFKKDSVVDLKLSDFTKGTIIRKPHLSILLHLILILMMFLSHITGDFLIVSPINKI